MWPSQEEQLRRINEALDVAALTSVCPRCRFRLAGIKNSREQMRAEPLVEQDQECPKRARYDSLPVCLLCLGLLQESVMGVRMEELFRQVQTCDFDALRFSVSLSLPVTLLMRAKSIHLWLADKMGESFDEDDVVSLKQVWKWVFSDRAEKIAGRKYATGDDCDFFVELRVDSDEEEKEIQALQAMCKEEYEMRKKRQKVFHMGVVTRQGAEKSLEDVSVARFKEHYSVPPSQPSQPFSASVVMTHNNLFLAGRYNKYVRELPQTPWMVDGERRMDSSVEELMSQRLKEAFTFDVAKFGSSGREDVDVRMLGRGRPFIFECTNPRKIHFTRGQLDDIQQKINVSAEGLIRVRDLQVVHKSAHKTLKEGEDQKMKTYTALCILPVAHSISVKEVKEKLEAIHELEIGQKTPIRVLHRRPNAVRQRTVRSMKVEPLNGHVATLHQDSAVLNGDSSKRPTECSDKNVLSRLFKLNLSTQAGTYVKEFVHGDFGRTRPNLREILGCEVDIVALDVESIDLDWPPPIGENLGSG